MSLVLHSSIEPVIAKLQDNLPQGLLLTGARGVGLGTIARSLAGKNLATTLAPTDVDDKSDPLYGNISIDDIRHLYESTRSKTLRPRVVIIDDINRMTRQAQNAFLKLLEEPPNNTYFMATAHEVDTLLPTIRSRLQALFIPLTTPEQDKQLLTTSKYTASELAQVRFIGNGRPAELYRLTNDRAYFDKKRDNYTLARDFMSVSAYQRVIRAAKITNRSDAIQFIDTVIVIIRSALRSSPQTESIASFDKLLRARERILANGNVKLWLLYTAL